MSNLPRQYAPQSPLLFDEFFEMGLQESVSPFLTPDSRKWGSDLTIKAALIAGILLMISFALSWIPEALNFSYLLLIAVYCLAGIPALIESVEDLVNYEINIDILMTLAAFSSVLIGSGMEGGLLLVLFSLSGAMEDTVTERAKSAISSLHKLSPSKATVLDEEGLLVERAVGDIAIGTHILVKSGETVPLDGIITEGISSLSLAHLTGENFPLRKTLGDEVPAGAQNLEGAFTLKVTRTSADSTLSRIIQLVTQAQEARPALQRWFDRLSNRYAATIISLSALFALTFPFLLNIPFLGMEGSLYRALAFLIAASPCALIIAIPIAYLSAISSCAKKGILLKGGVALDALASCRVIAFDKTGTLTTGELTLIDIESVHGSSIEEAFDIAYAMEKNAVHPIAKAILNHPKIKNLRQVTLKDYRSIPGYGLEAYLDGKPVYIGNPEYIQSKLPMETSALLESKLEQYRKNGELIAVLLVGDDLSIFRFQDTLRTEIQKTIQEIKQEKKYKLVMLTGDHLESASRVALKAGIDEFYADLKPEDKLSIVAKLSHKEGLAMIGDGVNDAPALARATVGICMGKVGSTAAVEAADIILLQDNIERLHWLLTRASKTQVIVKQNLTLATLAIIVASIPALGGIVPLWLAVVMHEGGTVLVGLNALRLLR